MADSSDLRERVIERVKPGHSVEATAKVFQVSPACIYRWRDRLMQAQQPISLKRNQAEVGKVVDVLIKQVNPATGEMIGRSARFALDVNGLVYVKGGAALGQLAQVRIEVADVYDLFGSVC